MIIIRTLKDFLNKALIFHIVTYFLPSYLKVSMSKIAHSQFGCHEGCSVELTLSLIGQKYKGAILYRLLSENTLRFSDLWRAFPEVSQKTLTNQLRALEKDGLIVRTVYPVVPAKVDYRLSEYGKTLANVIYELKNWGDNHKQHQQS